MTLLITVLILLAVNTSLMLWLASQRSRASRERSRLREPAVPPPSRAPLHSEGRYGAIAAKQLVGAMPCPRIHRGRHQC